MKVTCLVVKSACRNKLLSKQNTIIQDRDNINIIFIHYTKYYIQTPNLKHCDLRFHHLKNKAQKLETGRHSLKNALLFQQGHKLDIFHLQHYTNYLQLIYKANIYLLFEIANSVAMCHWQFDRVMRKYASSWIEYNNMILPIFPELFYSPNRILIYFKSWKVFQVLFFQNK